MIFHLLLERIVHLLKEIVQLRQICQTIVITHQENPLLDDALDFMFQNSAREYHFDIPCWQNPKPHHCLVFQCHQLQVSCHPLAPGKGFHPLPIKQISMRNKIYLDVGQP